MRHKQELLELMMSVLAEALRDQGSSLDGVTVKSPLIGAQALMTSLAFVSLIGDIEMALADQGVEVTLVSEKALSRSQSPFRNLEALADYVVELGSDPTPDVTATSPAPTPT